MVINLINQYFVILLIRIQNYFEFNDAIFNKFIRFNKTYLVFICKDLDEYMRGQQNRARVILNQIRRCLAILFCIKLLLTSFMKEVICLCKVISFS